MLDPRSLTLVAITDGIGAGLDELVARATAAVRGGATMVQLRLKDEDARTQVNVARRLVAALPVPVIVNDRADIAMAAAAAGVHVGAEDLPVSAVRRFAPIELVVGASVGSEAEVAAALGADYVGVGPVFATRSKGDAGLPLGVSEMVRLALACRVPAVAIGGIRVENVRSVIETGVAGVAVIEAVFGSSDPERGARALRSAIGR
ncbi:MAG: thiamine phosphate synthase [Gemmatimonadota bacterium]|nr:thiamine phosphate synthase [Gemmatimonadota bacterium]